MRKMVPEQDQAGSDSEPLVPVRVLQGCRAAKINGTETAIAAVRNRNAAAGDTAVHRMASEKQTVGIEAVPPRTAANTAAKPLDNAGPGWTAVECRPSAQTALDGPGRCARYYGSDAP